MSCCFSLSMCIFIFQKKHQCHHLNHEMWHYWSLNHVPCLPVFCVLTIKLTHFSASSQGYPRVCQWVSVCGVWCSVRTSRRWLFDLPRSGKFTPNSYEYRGGEMQSFHTSPYTCTAEINVYTSFTIEYSDYYLINRKEWLTILLFFIEKMY